MNRSLLLAAVSLLLPIASGAVPRVASYQLDVTLDPAESSLSGSAIVVFEEGNTPSPRTFFLHGELTTRSITLGGNTLEFDQEPVLFRSDYSLVAQRVVFEPPPDSTGPVEIRWHGYFHPSRARSPSDYMRIEPRAVLLRSFGYSLWFPVFVDSEDDIPDPADFRATIRAPSDLIPIFVGTRLSSSIEGDVRISRWEARELPVFAAQLTARPYEVRRRDSVFAYSLPDEASLTAADRVLELATRLKERFRERYDAASAIAQLHVMEMPRYGDIASGNVIGISESTWLDIADEIRAQRVIAHELVHAYVAPRIAANDPLWGLVVEGFPSYFHLPVLEELGWGEDYDAYLDQIEASYLEKRRTGKSRRGWNLPPEIPISSIGPEELGEYKDLFVVADRALLFLDALRRQAGVERFDRTVKEIVSRESLDDAALRRLFRQWAPEIGSDLDLWLDSIEFPERFRRTSTPAGKSTEDFDRPPPRR